MEASGNPPPPEEPAATPATPPPPPPPPPATAEVDDGKASGGWRALSVVLFLALAFACAVMIIAMADIADTPIQKDCHPPPTGDCTEYFDGSSAQKTITLVLGWPSGVLAGIAALVALYFAATGRRGRLLLQLTAAAIVLGAVSILIGSV
jgi:hypothetical protein